MSYRRYVALGDSTTEGLEDRYPNGEYRGWADRLGERLAQLEPGFRYANPAVRGKRARHVPEEPIEAEVAPRPDPAGGLAGLHPQPPPTLHVPPGGRGPGRRPAPGP